MELYINNFKVDINDRLPFPLTYSISDLKDLTARKGNNSKTITVPGTKGNLYLFFNAFQLTMTAPFSAGVSTFDFDPTIKATARYYESGLLQFNGFAQLSECEYLNGEWSFNLILFSDQLEYIAKLQQTRINELDWSEYVHTLTRQNQVDTWNGLIQVNSVTTANKTGANWDGLGYYYGLIDYGYDRSTPSTFDVDHIAPQVFVYDILKRSFDACGITWNSTFLESQTFKRLLLAFAGGNFNDIDATTASDFSSTNDEINKPDGYIISNDINFGAPYLSQLYELAILYVIDQPQVWQSPLFVNTLTDIQLQMTGEEPFKFQSGLVGLYQFEYAGQHDVIFDFTVVGTTLTNGNVTAQYNLLYYKNGSYVATDTIYNVALSGATGDVTATIAFSTTRNFDLDINDEITITTELKIIQTVMEFANVANLTSFNCNVSIDSVGVNANMNKLINQIVPGASVTLNSFLPDMDAATFLKGLTTAFNLYVKPSTIDPTVLEIEPLNDFYDTPNNALQWGDKVDYSRTIKVTPTVNVGTRYYNFKFAEDTDYYNKAYTEDVEEQYGSFQVDTQTQFSKDTTNFVLPFSQKLLVNIPINESTFTGLIMPRTFQVRFNADTTSDITPMKGKPFIVQLGPMTTANWTHVDENGVANAETSYPYVGHLDNLTSPTFDFNWGVPQYIYYNGIAYTNNTLFYYHDQFMKELSSKYGKLMNCYIRITPDMINLLDFRSLINIDGVVYRLQKIENYDSGKDQTTMVELIRIIKSEGLVANNAHPAPPYNPISSKFFRILEDGEFRCIEDGEMRKVEF
jgi:hypothetical protein